VQARAQELLAEYEETGQGWFWETDRRGQLTYLSATVAETVGRKTEDLVGKPFTDLFDLSEQSGDGERTLTFHLSARSSFSELAVRAVCRDDERWWSITGRPTMTPSTTSRVFAVRARI
jgi:PAS domain S-box-containing protein